MPGRTSPSAKSTGGSHFRTRESCRGALASREDCDRPLLRLSSLVWLIAIQKYLGVIVAQALTEHCSLGAR